MQPEQRGSEGRRSFVPRFKFGLETPLVGRYVGEDKKLVFAPPLWYDRLMLGCVVGGLLAVATNFTNFGNELLQLIGSWWWIGAAVTFAGIWAYLSNERLVCDLRSGTFTRWEGTGLFVKVSRGRLQDLDAVVLLASRFLAPFGHGVQYRMVLHWKGSRWPLLVVGQWSYALQPGQPLNAAAGSLLGLGARYSKSLGVAFYDNSYFESAPPQRAV